MAPPPFTSATPAPLAETPAAAAPSGAHALVLKLSAASWVEILGTDGNKLEDGILPAGSERRYTSDTPLSVRLGNAEGAEVSVDGKIIDLAPYRNIQRWLGRMMERESLQRTLAAAREAP